MNDRARALAVLLVLVAAGCQGVDAMNDGGLDGDAHALDAGADVATGLDAADRAPPADVPGPRWDALPDPSDASLPLACAWGDVQNRVLPSCLGFGCHEAPGAAGLVLDSTHAYGALVGVPSTTVPGERRVRPGDPDHSFLWRKLTNRLAPDGGEGLPMPRDEGGTDWLQLSQDDLRLVYCWILTGAAGP